MHWDIYPYSNLLQNPRRKFPLILTCFLSYIIQFNILFQNTIIIITNYQNTQFVMDIFMLVITIIGSLISVIVDIYLIILYTHRDEPLKSFISILCRILVLLSLLQVQLQPLFLLFDVMNSQAGGADISILWMVVYFSIFANIAFLKPLATSIYEGDEEDPIWKRILWVIIQVVIYLSVFGVFLGVGWLLWGKVYMPITEISVDQQYIFGQAIAQVITQSTIQMETTIPCFLIGLLCILGYPILACCGACGMTALPMSLIIDFKNRPKWRRTNEAQKITDQLKMRTVQLIKDADKIRRAVNRVDYIDGWFAKRKRNQQIQATVCDLQNKIQQHRTFYELFRLELEMAETNPCVFIFKLIGGIFFLIVLVPLWWVQILLSQLIFQDGVFLDRAFIILEYKGAGFVAVGIIFILTFYMILAVLKGIFFISESIPFISIHPISQGRTWLNSFLFQTSLATLAATSMIHLIVTSFPQFLRSGDIAVMMGIVLEGMQFVGVFTKNHVFVYIFLINTFLGLFWSIFKMCCFNGKQHKQLRIEQLREKVFKKGDKNKEINIQMTEIALNPSKTHENVTKKLDKTSKSKSSRKKQKKIKLDFA